MVVKNSGIPGSPDYSVFLETGVLPPLGKKLLTMLVDLDRFLDAVSK